MLKVINGYQNLGDVNLEHGIILIKNDNTNNDCFYILKTAYDEDNKDFILYDLYIDITDSWINWDDVKTCCDTDLNISQQMAIDATSYYSYLNFGTSETFNSLQELENKLRKVYKAIA